MELLETYFTASFQWVLRATFQGSLLVCLILAIKLALRERLPACWHYCLWLVLLVRLVLPWAPQSRLSIYNLVPQSLPSRHAIPGDGAHSEAVTAKSGAAEQEGTTGLVLTDTQDETPQQGQDAAAASPPPTVASQQSDAVSTEGRRPFVESAAAAAPWLWLAGCLLLGGYILGRAFALWWAVRSERPVTDQQILDLLEDCKMQMGVRTIVGVVVTDRTRSPALFGFLRPRILLPDGLIETLSLDELHYVFLHELAHLRRRDIYLAWLVCLVQVLHWFNPLMWYAFRRMRADQEMAADALALSAAGTDESHRYGRTIVNLLERFSRPQYLPSLAGILENRSHIERRMTMIARFKPPSHRWSPLAAVLIAVLACTGLPDAPHGKNALAASSPQIVLRQVWSGPGVDAYGGPSSDGEYLSFTDWETGDLALRELATGKTRRLTEGKKGGKENFRFALTSVISPDGRQIAYSWTNEYGTYDLCVIGTDGSGDHTLYSSEDHEIYPAAWSPDGRRILARRYTCGNKGNLAIVSVSAQDGTVQVYKTESVFWPRLCYSPNGRFVAYDYPVAADSGTWDIAVIDCSNDEQTALIEHPANDRLLGWAPRSQEVLFQSDRAGTYDVWAATATDGTVDGSPRAIMRDIGQIEPQGFTNDGCFYFSRFARRPTSYTVPLDATTGGEFTW